MLKTAMNPQITNESKRQWELKFLRSPVEFLTNRNELQGVKLGINSLEVSILCTNRL